MHYHCEILMPPTDDVQGAVDRIMAPFCEHTDDGDDWRYSFWDFFVIGGRWAGEHTQARIDPTAMKEFRGELARRRVTVSGLQFGKETLSPASQIPEVDALWREMVPGAGRACLLFSHSGQSNEEDVCRYAEVPERLTCERFILAGFDFQDKLHATYMLEREYWNGVTHIRSDWDGSVKTAIERALGKISHYPRELAERCTPFDDWLLVTVDYHS